MILEEFDGDNLQRLNYKISNHVPIGRSGSMFHIGSPPLDGLTWFLLRCLFIFMDASMSFQLGSCFLWVLFICTCMHIES